MTQAPPAVPQPEPSSQIGLRQPAQAPATLPQIRARAKRACSLWLVFGKLNSLQR